MRVGEKLFKFLARPILEKFYGTVTVRFENGMVTHVETEARRLWQYNGLPVVGNVRLMCDGDGLMGAGARQPGRLQDASRKHENTQSRSG